MRIPEDLPPRRPVFSGGGFGFSRPRRSRIILSAVLIAIVALFVSARSVVGFYIDVLWHQSVGRTDVFGASCLPASVWPAFLRSFLRFC